MNRIFFAALLCLMSLTANAQWKVTGIDNADTQGNKFIQIIQTERSTLIYATLTMSDGQRHALQVDRTTTVEANGQSYKILNSVNLPIKDEAENRTVVLDNQLNTVNYVMEFEKFDPSNGFDIIEDASRHKEGMFNFTGIHTQPMEETEAALDTERFLNCPMVIRGSYLDNGNWFVFYIRDGLMISQHCSIENDPIFYTKIVNNTNHGVTFDFDKVKVIAVKHKNSGDVESEAKIFTPDKYDSKIASWRYQAAKEATGGYQQDQLNYKLDSESYNQKNSSWARIGYSALGFLSRKSEANRIEKYLEEHPDNSPKALRSNSMKSGDEMNGFIAAKNKRYNTMTMQIPMDGYTFTFDWSLK